MFALSLISPLILLIGTVLGIVRSARNSAQEWIIWGFLVTALTIEGLSLAAAYSPSENNLHFLSFSTFFEFVFFSVLYVYFFLQKRRNWLIWVLSGIALILLIPLFSMTIIADLTKFHLYDRLLADWVLLLLSLLFLKDLLNDAKDVPKHRQFSSIIISFYLVVDMFMALTINFMVNEAPTLVTAFWLIRLAASLTLYSNLTYLIWLNGKKLRPSSFG